MRELSLDFNPRDLVPSITASESTGPDHADAQLQAVYVPTRGRPRHVERLLATLRGSHATVYLLLSSRDDVPTIVSGSAAFARDLYWQDDAGFLAALRSLRCASNPLFATSETSWDLPLKRNYALWHAHKNRYRRILLVDDDICGLTDKSLRAGARALSHWVLAGFFVDDFPDTSMLGHVELAVGERLFPFLSGSCLFVRCRAPNGFFPPIYNEDWIFMAPHIANGDVGSLGSIRQTAYDPFSEPCRAAFQEPGEIVADGLFALLAAGRYTDRSRVATWNTLLSLRRDWLRSLAARAADPRHRVAVDVARAVSERIAAEDCVDYVGDLERDRQQWTQKLEVAA